MYVSICSKDKRGQIEKKSRGKSIIVTLLIRNTWSPLIHIQSLLYHTRIIRLLFKSLWCLWNVCVYIASISNFTFPLNSPSVISVVIFLLKYEEISLVNSERYVDKEPFKLLHTVGWICKQLQFLFHFNTCKCWLFFSSLSLSISLWFGLV